MGTLTINTTAAQDARIAAAFGARHGYGRNATGAEVKADVIQFLKDVVQQQEQLAAAKTAVDAVTPIDAPT